MTTLILVWRYPFRLLSSFLLIFSFLGPRQLYTWRLVDFAFPYPWEKANVCNGFYHKNISTLSSAEDYICCPLPFYSFLDTWLPSSPICLLLLFILPDAHNRWKEWRWEQWWAVMMEERSKKIRAWDVMICIFSSWWVIGGGQGSLRRRWLFSEDLKEVSVWVQWASEAANARLYLKCFRNSAEALFQRGLELFQSLGMSRVLWVIC